MNTLSNIKEKLGDDVVVISNSHWRFLLRHTGHQDHNALVKAGKYAIPIDLRCHGKPKGFWATMWIELKRVWS